MSRIYTTFFGSPSRENIDAAKKNYSPLTKSIITDDFIIKKDGDTILITRKTEGEKMVTEDQLNTFAIALNECMGVSHGH